MTTPDSSCDIRISRGFSITTHSKVLRVDGTWVYTMHGPDGKDWPNFTRYHVVEPQK